VSETLPGYYLCAGLAGMIGYQGVGQGFTNLTLNGFSGVLYSSQYFSRSQLDTIAGGGIYILFQETPTSAVKTRHQLSTDVTSIEKRELSITKSIDFVSSSLRLNLKNKIGALNLVDETVTAIGVIAQAIIQQMVDLSIVASASMDRIAVNSVSPDTLDITISIAPLYPCNYIQITLEV
jgi:hypothetical protein